jgi:chitinase
VIIVAVWFSACTAIVDGPEGRVDASGSVTSGTGSSGATGATGGASSTSTSTTSTTSSTHGAGGSTGTGTGTGTGGAKVADSGSDRADVGTNRPDASTDAGPPGACVLDRTLTANTFNGWFGGRASVYSYMGLCTALAKPLYSKFANSGDLTADKREVAAFFAHVAWETGNLVFTDQQQKDPATGMYWGRGPLQLTWDYNYMACGNAIGQPLVAQPDLVSRDPIITWETALWFWLYDDSGKGFTSHTAIGRGSFGDTLRVINSIECTAGNSAQQGRIANYTKYCNQLTVDPGTQLTCQ